MTFDVRTDPWIPVVYLDGHTAEIGLQQALIEAHNIGEIRDPIPTIEFGLYRLLVALVHDIVLPPSSSMSALGRLWTEGRFDAAAITKYFDMHADRFDLFHPTFPFLQTGGMEAEEAKPLAGLFAAIPSGTNAAHFHHASEEAFGVGAAAAARLLTTLAPFMTAGGAGLSPSINGAPPWYVLVVGSTLFATLCLNSCIVPNETSTGDGPPTWRNDAPPATTRAKCTSLVEGLTWRPRRLQLIPGPGGVCAVSGQTEPVLIRSMRFIAGASVDFPWRDPNVAYRVGAEKGPTPFRPQEDRELWRDTGPLALLKGTDERKVRCERPLIVEQAILLMKQGRVSKETPINLQLYGMRTDMKMKVFEWQRERLTIPVGVAEKEGLGRGKAQEAMDLAEEVAFLIKQAIKKAYPRDGGGNAKAFETRTRYATREYWQALRSPYEELLKALAVLPDGEGYQAALNAANGEWQQQLKGEGRNALDAVLADLDTDARAIERAVEARRFFANRLWAKLNPEEDKARRQTGNRRGNSTKGGDA